MNRMGLLALLLVFSLASARADEGMWTFDNIPADRLAAAAGFTPSKEWLDHVRLASARLAGGCSASFVSPDGLVMTNHHCVEDCVLALSSAAKDYQLAGFLAAAAADERRCPDFEINQLLEIRDVTSDVNDATKGLEGEPFLQALRAIQARLESTCATAADARCDLVTLYGGGLYHLYKFRRWQDVRLVFAPEIAAANFGGDPDNFNFPRYALDCAFLRVYESGRPATTPEFFRFAPTPAKEADLVFVSGNPGHTSRLSTAAELEFERGWQLPMRLLYLSEERGLLTEFSNRGAEQKRTAMNRLLDVENTLKSLRGLLRALNDPSVFDLKLREERQIRSRVDADPALKASTAGAWDAIARAKREERSLLAPYSMIEQARGFDSSLFDYARTLVRAADELRKPAGKRLPEFEEARLPELREALLAPTPVYREVEIATLTFSLTKLREELGADDPFVKSLLGRNSPRELAEAAVNGSRLGDPALRKTLLDGGSGSIKESTDPMILLARQVDPQARAIRKTYESVVEAVVKTNHELIAKARFAIYGRTVYPDATFTARLSFGFVKGWSEPGRLVGPFTTFGGLYERATGREPFDLAKSWLDAKGRLILETPFNVATTNDIVGGNSGSPVIDIQGRLVGLVFDGNIHSLAGEYWFDPALNRTVAVTGIAILEALEKVYGAKRLVAEIRPAAK